LNGQIKFSSTDEQYSSVYTEKMPVSKALYANYINQVLLLHEASYLIKNFVVTDLVSADPKDFKEDPAMYDFFIKNVDDHKPKLLAIMIAITTLMIILTLILIYIFMVFTSTPSTIDGGPLNPISFYYLIVFGILSVLAIALFLLGFIFINSLLVKEIPEDKNLNVSYKIFKSLRDIKKINEVSPKIITDFTNSDEYKKHFENVTNYTFPNEVVINDFLNKMGSPDDTDPSLPMYQ
jgi:hypothetical protein